MAGSSGTGDPQRELSYAYLRDLTGVGGSQRQCGIGPLEVLPFPELIIHAPL